MRLFGCSDANKDIQATIEELCLVSDQVFRQHAGKWRVKFCPELNLRTISYSGQETSKNQKIIPVTNSSGAGDRHAGKSFASSNPETGFDGLAFLACCLEVSARSTTLTPSTVKSVRSTATILLNCDLLR